MYYVVNNVVKKSAPLFRVLREQGDCNFSIFSEGVQLFDTLLIFSADSLLQKIPFD